MMMIEVEVIGMMMAMEVVASMQMEEKIACLAVEAGAVVVAAAETNFQTTPLMVEKQLAMRKLDVGEATRDIAMARLNASPSGKQQERLMMLMKMMDVMTMTTDGPDMGLDDFDVHHHLIDRAHHTVVGDVRKTSCRCGLQHPNVQQCAQ